MNKKLKARIKSLEVELGLVWSPKEEKDGYNDHKMEEWGTIATIKKDILKLQEEILKNKK